VILAGSKIPIDKAMAQLAKGDRDALIAPQQSDDLGPMTGWSKLPKKAPVVASAPGAANAMGSDAGAPANPPPANAGDAGAAPGAHATDAGGAPGASATAPAPAVVDAGIDATAPGDAGAKHAPNAPRKPR
jgi:hypothetical protein